MIEIGLKNITKNYGFKNILNGISFDVKTNEILALIGQNGSGKSTLLKIIAGIETATSGNIAIRSNATLGILNQTQDVVEDYITVKDILYKGIEELINLRDKLSYFEENMACATGKDLKKLLNNYGKLQEEFINLGGYEINEKIGRVQTGFNIKPEILNIKFNLLSGGEKTLINFAALILNEPDILLLDEPTNNLDINTLEWLENFLSSYKGTILICSHDRYFLDKVATKTVLIENQQIEIFHGNYSHFLEENEKRIMQEFKDFKNQQKQIMAMKAAIKKLREWGKIGDNESFFKRAVCMEKRLARMELVNKPLEKKDIPLDFNGNIRSGQDVIVVKDLNLGYDNKVLLEHVNFKLRYGEKVCLMGGNGTGKSTLIKKIIFNENEAIKLGTNIVSGYIPQEIYFDNDKITILEEAKKYYEGTETVLRSSLSKFLFNGEQVFKKVGILSGGEKVRLKLFCLIQEKPNLLILDEPTNHIDIDTKEILESALQDYQGTLLFISHDRYFINKLADRIINIENMNLVNYIGNYNDYKNKNK